MTLTRLVRCMPIYVIFEISRIRALHWLSCNEEPKAGLSERAVANDSEAKRGPTQSLRTFYLYEEWAESELAWWKLREEGLLNVSVSSYR